MFGSRHSATEVLRPSGQHQKAGPMSRSLARSCRAGGADQCPKLGVERTQRGHATTVKSDPEQSFAQVRLNEIANRNNSIRQDLGPYAAAAVICLRKSSLASHSGRYSAR